ncbi:uncharacterized protein L969DRAFT_92176 [Mixia osmundae IAM 14324]|uniref:Pre-rRNA-processing protein n=1 Tax=Mixia osmundae (strain CBS 9802 / IAM 14324 / JCM 22182 / KY 12970) TaxID=764103 RepID=G7DT38_MIXOS|nr:uncharacterized protein L969DRAFT_92176 [Mixia osmundae IAM 14324]KEI42750.1 hypothetical protein L969DRAFT_92176 [Mixia osmundae IAM 14324]GAA93917.1 hypothetical protein E5Q_00563 [Mixia osmundae IAM 14324]
MAKATKKKKEKKADFTKAKLKLGKGPLKSANATSTAFTARAINVSHQSLGSSAKEGEATTNKRRQTLADLLASLTHHNASTRKDALLGLQELFTLHPHLAQSSLGPVISATIRLGDDTDFQVRRALQSFYRFHLARIDRTYLSPYHSMLNLHLSSVLSNIFPEIRLDGIRLVDIMLEHTPDMITAGWAKDGRVAVASDAQNDGLAAAQGQRYVDAYLSLLQISASSSMTMGVSGSGMALSLSPASKLVVFKGLATFLDCALHPRTSRDEAAVKRIPSWYLARAFSSPRAFAAFERSLARAKVVPRSYDLLASQATAAAQDLFGIDAEILALTEAGIARQQSEPAQLIASLQPTLVSAYLDYAPTAFMQAPGPVAPLMAAEMIHALAKIARDLYRSALVRLTDPATFDAERDSKDVARLRSGLIEMLQRMSGHLPIPDEASRSAHDGSKIRQFCQDTNLAYCELVSLASLALPSEVATHKTSKAMNSLAVMQQSVRDYLLTALQEADILGGDTPKLTSDSLLAILPIIWTILDAPTTPEVDRQLIFRALLDRFARAKATTEESSYLFQFISMLCRTSLWPSYRGRFDVQSEELQPDLHKWLCTLPRFIFQLGPSRKNATECVAAFLRDIAATQDCRPFGRAAMAEMSASLHPLFNGQHPKRGAVPGVFVQATPQTQQHAFGAVNFILTDGLLNAEQSSILQSAVMTARDLVDEL